MRVLAAGIVMISLYTASDAIGADWPAGTVAPGRSARADRFQIVGRAVAVSGDTLWFPRFGLTIGLKGIQACRLPQWAFDPRAGLGEFPAPVACGPLAKAWLKRLVRTSSVRCAADLISMRETKARCLVHGQDLGEQMLRVGWARVTSVHDPKYTATERIARAARYGLWATYVLDMAEWQREAVDRTTGRRPSADWNLLRTRESEITPPFNDWRNRPRRTDR